MYRCGYNNNKSGGIHNSYSTGGQGFMAVSKSSVYTLVLSLFTAINLLHCAITIIYTPFLLTLASNIHLFFEMVLSFVRITMATKLKIIEMLITTT